MCLKLIQWKPSISGTANTDNNNLHFSTSHNAINNMFLNVDNKYKKYYYTTNRFCSPILHDTNIISKKNAFSTTAEGKGGGGSKFQFKDIDDFRFQVTSFSVEL